jgi:hypothetical protein
MFLGKLRNRCFYKVTDFISDFSLNFPKSYDKVMQYDCYNSQTVVEWGCGRENGTTDEVYCAIWSSLGYTALFVVVDFQKKRYRKWLFPYCCKNKKLTLEEALEDIILK